MFSSRTDKRFRQFVLGAARCLREKIHKIIITSEYHIRYSCRQWTAQGLINYNVIANENSQLIFDLRWQAMDMTEFRQNKLTSFCCSTRVYQCRKYERNRFLVGKEKNCRMFVWKKLFVSLNRVKKTLEPYQLQMGRANRPFPNYLRPLFRSESWCSSFHVQINFHSHAN